MGMLSLVCVRKCRIRTWKRRCLSTGTVFLTAIILLNLNPTSYDATQDTPPANQPNDHHFNQHRGFNPSAAATTFLGIGANLRTDGVPAWLVRKLLAASAGGNNSDCRLNFLDGPPLYDLTATDANNNNNWTCLNSSTAPATPLCIYEPADDKYVSAQLAVDGVWEPALTSLFQVALRRYARALVLDLGANVGWYTLLAARMGHRVLAVEPVRESVARLRTAAQLAGTARRIALLPRAVAEARGLLMTFRYKPNNKGGTSVRPVARGEIAGILRRDCYGVVHSVTMDDLADLLNSSVTVIVKMDIEGYECKALATSSRFFNKHFVPYVFMEWETMFRNRHRYGAPCKQSHMQQAVDRMVALGYTPTDARNGRQLETERAALDWRLGDVIWRHKSAPPLLPIQR